MTVLDRHTRLATEQGRNACRHGLAAIDSARASRFGSNLVQDAIQPTRLRPTRLGEAAKREALYPLDTVQVGKHLRQRMPPVKVRIAIRADDQRVHPLALCQHVLQQQHARLVRPVKVVEDQHQRLVLRRVP